MKNEKCGACGSAKTSILGKDKRVGKTCGNEDCPLHLTVIDWPPAPGEAPAPTPEALDLEAKRQAWAKLKESLGPEKWSVGDSFTYEQFFCHGWEARRLRSLPPSAPASPTPGAQGETTFYGGPAKGYPRCSSCGKALSYNSLRGHFCGNQACKECPWPATDRAGSQVEGQGGEG